MSGLILKLRPHEELMINGVLVENGERNTRLRVKTEGAKILRVRDALTPEEVTTPLKKAYYVAQLAVAGQLPNKEAAMALTDAIGKIPELADHQELLAPIENYQFYKVMSRLRPMVLTDRDYETTPTTARQQNETLETAISS